MANDQMAAELKRQIASAREELTSRLEEIARCAAKDAEDVHDGVNAWYAPGQYASDGSKIDLLNERLRTLVETLRILQKLIPDD